MTGLQQFMYEHVDSSGRAPIRARAGGRSRAWISQGLLLAGLLAAWPAAGAAAATNALSNSECLV
ncbi:MAG: hypothetical protein NTV49_04080, partial [Kiritimatiellaeota bacterium]|nr:hypothetical protein [Kiritimatiellota bacterium]